MNILKSVVGRYRLTSALLSTAGIRNQEILLQRARASKRHDKISFAHMTGGHKSLLQLSVLVSSQSKTLLQHGLG